MLKPGSGIIVTDLGRGRVVTLDLVAFLTALHQEVLSRHDEDWWKMAETALVKTLGNKRDDHTTP
jgi:hypothetical protein